MQHHADGTECPPPAGTGPAESARGVRRGGTSLDLRFGLRALLLRVLDDGALRRLLEDGPAPPAAPEVVVAGDEPLTVLLVGAGGLERGYGVDRQGDALSGRIAERLSSTTGRGVRLVICAVGRRGSTAAGPEGSPRAVRSAARSVLQHSAGRGIVIVTPDLEEVFRLSRRRGRARMRALLLWCDSGAAEAPLVVLTGLPVPRVASGAGRLFIRQCETVNRDLQAAATARGGRTVYRSVSSYASAAAGARFDAVYYDDVARDVVECALLGASGPHG